MQRITPFMWFNNQAEEAREFYVSVFENSRIGATVRHGDAGPGPKATVMTAAFELDGQELVALSGGPLFNFSPAISFVVNCDTRAEVDEYWERLSAGGEPHVCGWLKDRYGVSWRIVPRALTRMLTDRDAGRTFRFMQALMNMQKLKMAELERAFDGR